MSSSARCWGRRRSMTWFRSVLLGLASVVGVLVHDTTAAPLSLQSHELERRQSSSSNSSSSKGSDGGISPQVWIPAVVIVLVLLAVFCFMWTRRGFLYRMRGASSTTATPTPVSSTSIRELTADQLSGGNASDSTTAAGGNQRSTRPRRTRRTPSQISTASLPVYMKEPGDQELVIFRGPDEMDDPLRPGIPEADENENDDELERTSTTGEDGVRMRDPRMYNPAPASAQNLSILTANSRSAITVQFNPDDAADASTAELMPRSETVLTNTESDEDTTRRESVGGQTLSSTESRDSSDSRTGLVRDHIPTPDIPNEDAPPYSEAIAQYPGPVPHSPVTSSSEHSGSLSMSSPPGLSTPATSVSSSPTATTRNQESDSANSPTLSRNGSAHRRPGLGFSGLSNFFSLGGLGASNASRALQASTAPSAARPGQGEGQGNEASTTATRASNDTSNPPPVSGSTRHARHRSTQSGGSSSTLNLSLLRTISRQRSNNTLNGASSSRLNLTSPSMLSLNSISAPLSHTLLRTEIRYPPGGPTPEQIKFISSREGIEKFGMPYGRDAIAHAEASRLELSLDPPPPVFEDADEESDSELNEMGGSSTRNTDNGGEGDEIEEETPSASRSHSPGRGAGGRNTAHSSPERREASTSSAGHPHVQLLVPLFM